MLPLSTLRFIGGERVPVSWAIVRADQISRCSHPTSKKEMRVAISITHRRKREEGYRLRVGSDGIKKDFHFLFVLFCICQV